MYFQPRFLPRSPASRRLGFNRPAAACALIGALALIVTGCKPKADPHAAQAQHGPTVVSVVKVAQRPIRQGTSFIGRVEAIRSVAIVARVTGFVKKQSYIDGREVKAGDPLFSLEPDTYRAAVDAARATLAQAQANATNAQLQAQRAQTLVRHGNIAVATLDDRQTALKQANAQIQQARANLDQAQINLGYTDIRAPFAGRVGRANFKLGALVSPSTGPLTTIVSQDPIYVTFPVSDRLILDFRRQAASGENAYAGLRVRIFLSNGEEYPTQAKIDFTDVRVDPGTDTLLVRAIVPNNDRLLVDGQYARVTVERIDPVEALVVPQRAIVTDQSGTSVYVVGPDKKVVQKHVTTGQAIDADTVVEGVKEGELVVIDGLQTLRPGAVVDAQLVPAAAPPSAGAATDDGPPATVTTREAEKRRNPGT